MGIEIISLSFYILTAIKIYNNFSTEAGIKYFILGAFSSGILLYGCSLVYGFVGSVNFSDIYMFSQVNTYEVILDPLIIGFVFIFIGLLFKIGAAPFHM
jgi:NADH-quinone oxidoreductase subunit N